MKTSRLAVLAGALLIGAPAAQQPLSGLRVPIHTAEPDMGVEYGTWAAADSYKASFHDGMTFVPYLGSEYPKNQPWSWRTVSVRAGGVELLERGLAPTHWHGEFRYEYRFGAVTEAYDVRVDGLEQTFVIWQRPAPGDLVVTGRIDTALSAPVASAAHRALRFCDAAGDAIVGYGAAIAFDSAGHRIEVATGFDAGRITLTVPGAWLERATFPVTIDPLLTRETMATQSQTVDDVDIAHCRDAQATLTAYVRSASQFDDDVLAVADGGNIYWSPTVIYSDVTSSWDSDGVSCACQDQDTFQGTTNRFWAVVFRRYFANNPVRVSRIRAHTRTVTSALLTNVTGLTPPAYNNDWRPRVGGTARFTSPLDKMLVIFQSEDNGSPGHWSNTTSSYIAAAVLDPRASSFQGSRFIVSSFANQDSERPSVNKFLTQSSGGQWMCCWQSRLPGVVGDDWDLAVRPIDTNGGLPGAAWSPPANLANGSHKLGPQVAGHAGRYLLAYASMPTATLATTGAIRGEEIRVQRFDWGAGGSAAWPERVIAGDPSSPYYELRGLDADPFDQSHFALSYVRRTSANLWQLAYALLGYRGAPIETGAIWLLSSSKPAGGACTYEFTGFEYGYAITSTVYRQRLRYSQASPPTTAGFSCSTATLGWSGRQVVGSEFSGPYVNATAPVGHFLLASLATTDTLIQDPFVVPGCRLLVSNTNGYLGTMQFQFGASASWQFPLPEWLPPLTLRFQDWIFNGSIFESTARLDVPIVK